MLMFVWRYMICHLYFSIIQFWVNLLHLNICFNGDYQQRWLLVVIFSVKETWSQFESIPSNLDFCCCWFFSNVLINLKKKYIYQKLYNIIFELSNVKIWKLFIYFMHPKGLFWIYLHGKHSTQSFGQKAAYLMKYVMGKLVS